MRNKSPGVTMGSDHQQPCGTSSRDFNHLKGATLLLFLAAAKCRDSILRWTAVSLLRTLKLQEGAFHSDILSIYAQRIVELEESRAREMTGIANGVPLTCADVPEQARFLDVTLDLDESHIDIGILLCVRLSDHAEGSIEFERQNFKISEVAERTHRESEHTH